jgi:D-tyrosyl-tRNA(Tyr) deacylase
MRAVVQRVSEASVIVDGEAVASLDRPGLVALVGVSHTDTAEQAHALAHKLWTLRILTGDRSAQDEDAPVLVVSQFTLYGDTSRGRRPSWSAAAPASVAEPLVTAVADELRRVGATVSTGLFGAHMQVHLVNDGPVTLTLEV